MEGWDPRRIVVGVDGSDQSIHATRVAAGIARARDAELAIVTVVRPPEGWWGVVGSPPTAEALGDALSDAQQQVLDKTVASVDLEGISYDTFEEIGDPSQRLIEACDQMDADLLVVGRRGAGFIKRVVVGSVAKHVVDEAPCPVLIVP
jgi:nucleotide-binding universal stress UspA family protein